MCLNRAADRFKLVTEDADSVKQVLSESTRLDFSLEILNREPAHSAEGVLYELRPLFWLLK